MDSIHTTLCNNVYRAARSSPGLSGQSIADHLKLLNSLGGQFGTCSPCELIVVFDTVDVQAVAASAQARKTKPTVGESAFSIITNLN